MTVPSDQRIAVYTGVFDPVHLGHMEITCDMLQADT